MGLITFGLLEVHCRLSRVYIDQQKTYCKYWPSFVYQLQTYHPSIEMEL